MFIYNVQQISDNIHNHTTMTSQRFVKRSEVEEQPSLHHCDKQLKRTCPWIENGNVWPAINAVVLRIFATFLAVRINLAYIMQYAVLTLLHSVLIRCLQYHHHMQQEPKFLLTAWYCIQTIKDYFQAYTKLGKTYINKFNTTWSWNVCSKK